ncbi:hydroxyisourate hydrolase [Nitratireductor sp. XY-223]|uniref:hydroxyisourate hydrolase n=1 Tax=Nitratireductor sp. XY-223 TaxID=2561926 RepID=UPI0010A9DD20|nr:hydroxyisourate hydrolase [Nitratireductor sp. XY-223]
MAVISSHVLNGTDGTHAPGIPVVLKNLASGEILFDSSTDEGGRLCEQVDIAGYDPATEYELCFRVGIFWQGRAWEHTPIAREIVFRILMPANSARYHIPLIISPNSCACWTSVPEE